MIHNNQGKCTSSLYLQNLIKPITRRLMDTPLISKICTKTKAEKPYSEDLEMEDPIQTSNSLFAGLCNLKTKNMNCNKKGKYTARYRKPNPKEEVLILICIVKKGVKLLCRYSQNRNSENCKVPNYEQIYFFVDITKKIDKLKEKFIKIYNDDKNNLCCYAKLLKDIKTIKCCFSKEIQAHYNLYQCKLDLINCILSSLQTLENKIYYIMACCPSEKDVLDSTNNDLQINKSKSISNENNNSYESLKQAKSCRNESRCSNSNKTSKKYSLLETNPCGANSTDCCGNNNNGNGSNRGAAAQEKALPLAAYKQGDYDADSPDGKNGRGNNGKNGDKDGEKNNQIYDMTLDYYKYTKDDENDSESSDDANLIDSYQEEFPNGFIQSKMYKKDHKILLSLKCVTNGNENALNELKKEAETSNKSDKLTEVANDMAKLLTMSKNWYSSGQEVCREVLKES